MIDCACGEKPKPAMLLGDEHAEEALLAHEIPDVLGHVALIVPDLPIVEHLAELFGLVIEEALLLFGEHDGAIARSFSQSGRPENSSASKPMRAGVEGLLLGLGDRRQDALDHAEDRVRHHHAPRRAP